MVYKLVLLLFTLYYSRLNILLKEIHNSPSPSENGIFTFDRKYEVSISINLMQTNIISFDKTLKMIGRV